MKGENAPNAERGMRVAYSPLAFLSSFLASARIPPIAIHPSHIEVAGMYAAMFVFPKQPRLHRLTFCAHSRFELCAKARAKGRERLLRTFPFALPTNSMNRKTFCNEQAVRNLTSEGGSEHEHHTLRDRAGEWFLLSSVQRSSRQRTHARASVRTP